MRVLMTFATTKCPFPSAGHAEGKRHDWLSLLSLCRCTLTHSFFLALPPPPSPSPHLSPLASPHTTHEKARVQVDASNTRSGVPKQTSLDRAVKISAAWKIRCWHLLALLVFLSSLQRLAERLPMNSCVCVFFFFCPLCNCFVSLLDVLQRIRRAAPHSWAVSLLLSEKHTLSFRALRLC